MRFGERRKKIPVRRPESDAIASAFPASSEYLRRPRDSALALSSVLGHVMIGVSDARTSAVMLDGVASSMLCAQWSGATAAALASMRDHLACLVKREHQRDRD